MDKEADSLLSSLCSEDKCLAISFSDLSAVMRI